MYVKLNLLKNYTIPYTYQINKNEYEKREISLIHPFAQLKICDFYFKYETVILYNTCKSDISLRHPVKISSKTLKELDLLTIKLMEEDSSNIDINEVINYAKMLHIENIPNTYFTYSKYPMLYKFYESEEFLGLEQKYKYCLKFDIQKCFDNIYTHSICWAIKNKYYAKKNKNKDSFENKIDELMRYSNWEETNGIPIGSEFSRIFAEILLQKIDQEVEKQLKEYLKEYKKHSSNKQNFCIKRYVDDYFVFVNDEKFGENVIVNLYEKKLKEYKLFINKSKSKKIERPFLTNISVAKYKSMRVLRNYLTDNLIDNEQKQIRYSENLINQIRTIVYDNKVNMVDISNIMLSAIFKELLDVLKDKEIKQKNLNKLQKYLLEITNLSFYIFNLSLKSNSTNGICKICIVILEILKNIDNKENMVDVIKEKISFMLIQFFETKIDTDFQLLEYLDLIWILDIYEYKIPVERLGKILNKSNTYFEFMVLLSYIRQRKI